MTAKTRAELNAYADVALADNTTRAIDEEDVRQAVKDLADSAVFPEDLSSQISQAATRTALAALDPDNAPVVFLKEAGLEGLFVFDGADLSARVSNNPFQGLYIPPTGQDGSLGAWVRVTDVLKPDRDFGADFDGALNQEEPLEQLANEIVYRGGGKAQFPPGKTLHILDDGTFADRVKIMPLGVGLDKVEIDFNGCTLVNDYDFSTQKFCYLVYAEDIGSLEVSGLRYEQPNYNHILSAQLRGMTCVYAQGDCGEVRVHGVEMLGGFAPLTTSQSTGDGSDFPNGVSRVRSIYLETKVEGTVYGGSFSASGDQATLIIEATRVHRALIAYNIRQIDASVTLRPGPYGSQMANQVIIGVAGFDGHSPEARSMIQADIRVLALDDDPDVYNTFIGSGTAAAPEHAGVNIGCLNFTGDEDTFTSGIKFRIDGVNNGSWGYPFMATRLVGTAVHHLSDFEIGGHFTNNVASAIDGKAYSVFHDVHGTGDFSGDDIGVVTVRNLVIDGTHASACDFYFNLDYLDFLWMVNVKSGGDIVGVGAAAGKYIGRNNVQFANFDGATYGVPLPDSDKSHNLNLKAGSNLTADHSLTFTTGDADRTLTLTGDSSIGGTAYVAGGTDVPVTDGGTGASTAANARTNLGVGTADSPEFAAVNLSHASANTLTGSGGDAFIEGNRLFRVGGTDVPVADGGTGASTAANARTNFGVGTADSPEFAAVNLSHASANTLTGSGGDAFIEGNRLFRAGGTDVPVADGGTGGSDAATARSNLGAAASGANSDITSTSALVLLNGGALGGFRNFLINPNGVLNQRGAASNADNTYGHDRWLALTQTSTIAVSTVTAAENTTPHLWRLTQSQASAQRMGYAQWIEGINCKHLRGEAIVLNGRIRFSLNAAVRYAICEWTGTEDAPGAARDIVNDWTSATFTAGNFFKSTTFNVLAVGSITPAAADLINLTPLTATVGSSANNLVVFLWTEGTAAQNATLDGWLQLEYGTVLTKREIRPFAIEQHLCQRYFEHSFPVGTAPADNVVAYRAAGGCYATNNLFSQRIPFKAEKRIAPTMVAYSSTVKATPTAGQWQYLDATNTWADTNTAIMTVNDIHGFIWAGQATATRGDFHLVSGNWTADAEI